MYNFGTNYDKNLKVSEHVEPKQEIIQSPKTDSKITAMTVHQNINQFVFERNIDNLKINGAQIHIRLIDYRRNNFFAFSYNILRSVGLATSLRISAISSVPEQLSGSEPVGSAQSLPYNNLSWCLSKKAFA
ncbi:hypothetical protein SAMN04488514_11093 [Kriegella aquimaris]|uniref:Uncharacterized protein n=1 Tax=Kriegella aquimaris TaxID=192904 RepID=A0A1G9U2M3_9FLAO|nr:hypothetical protein SAMN04488514_11093 [Kriegella aquimaris]